MQIGTNIVVTEVISLFKQFLYDFKAEEQSGDMDVEGLETYILKITQLINENKTCLNLDCGDLRSFPTTTKLYTQLINFPSKVIPIFDYVVNEVAQEIAEGSGAKPAPIHVRIYNLDKKVPMRDLSIDNIDQLVCIEGMITRVGDLIPDLRVAVFRCSLCKNEERINRDGYRVENPTRCSHCHTIGSMQIDHNSGLFKDKQLIKMQEVPDQVPQGETPQSVCMYAHEELFDAVKPGDKVEVTGIYKAIPVRVNRKMSTVRDVFRTFIEVIHYRRHVDGRFTVEGEEMEEVEVREVSHVEPPY